MHASGTKRMRVGEMIRGTGAGAGNHVCPSAGRGRRDTDRVATQAQPGEKHNHDSFFSC